MKSSLQENELYREFININKHSKQNKKARHNTRHNIVCKIYSVSLSLILPSKLMMPSLQQANSLMLSLNNNMKPLLITPLVNSFGVTYVRKKKEIAQVFKIYRQIFLLLRLCQGGYSAKSHNMLPQKWMQLKEIPSKNSSMVQF